jgi:hypothetical protein
MALKGELTDLSLAELIEFFCNQRKTGRLTVSYPQSPAYFYLQSGSVVHASVGSLRGIEAVYYALTQSNASFNFSTAYEAPAQTINQPWTSVVLEGLRRMDEGILPRDPFHQLTNDDVANEVSESVPDAPVVESVTAPVSEFKAESIEATVDHVPEAQPEPVAPVKQHEPPPVMHATAPHVTKHEAPSKHKDEVIVEKQKQPAARPMVSDTFLSSTQSPSRFAPWKLAAVFAALVLIIAGIAVPWGWRVRGKTAKTAEQTQSLSDPTAPGQSSQATDNSQATANEVPAQSPDEAGAAPANTEAADAAKREREARAREEARLKAKAAENANPATAQASSSSTSPASAAQPSSAGAKKAVVTVTYDENGRVTQASGNDPTALRIARQRRFPPGKAGSATLTIPIN